MKKNLILSPLVMCLLSACNGGSGGNSSTDNVEITVTPKVVNIVASPTQSKAMVSEESTVKVSATNSENVAMKLVSVRSISGEACQVTSVEGLSFVTNSNVVGECQYEYTVSAENSDAYEGEGSSITRVSVSETASDNTLPNLSETTDIDTPVTIVLSQALEGDIDTSIFYLSEDASVLGAGIVDADSNNNTLTFTPFEVGVSRILYSMTDGASTMLGTIDVAVSDTQNTPPVASNYVREGKLDKGMLVTIDLTEYVSDAEDSVILESVRAYNAETEITSASEHTFTFRSSEPGAHEIAYTVNDGRGGYDVGQVYIEVEPDFSLVQDWEDIVVYDPTIDAEITFIAPASKVLADYTNTPYTGYRTQDGTSGPKNAEVVTMNLEQAQNYCATRNGRLPISREWELLNGSQGDLFSTQNWPAGTDFWSADMLSEGSGKSVNATNGATSELPKESGEGFVTCVVLDSDAVKDFSTELEYSFVDGVRFDLSGVVFDPDGELAPYQEVKLVSERKKGVFSNYESEISKVSGSSGELVDSYTDTSFNDEVLSSHTSASKVDSIVFKSEAASSRLELNNEDKWSRLAAEQESFKPLSSFGLPILDGRSGGGNLRTINVYQQEYTGHNFVVYMKVEDAGGFAPQNGRFSFAVQQESSQPSTEWGSTNWPSSPRTDKSFEVINDYWYQNAKVVSGWELYDETSMNLSTPERHLWIQVNDGMLEIYNSATSDKPESPVYKGDMNWSGIDPTQTYWIQIGSRLDSGHEVAEGIDTYVTEAYFTNY
ncbi:Ig-like domain-containing protein [Vibrio sp. VNB-15]